MARSVRGSKGPGYDYWAGRPCSRFTPGKVTKKLTHAAERAAERLGIDAETRELNAMTVDELEELWDKAVD